jgi:hypothetical protein
MAVRWYFIQGKIQDKTIELRYMETENMIADVMTKSLIGNKWREMRNMFLNIICDITNSSLTSLLVFSRTRFPSY